MQTVQVPDNHRVQFPRFDVGEQPLIGRAFLAAIGGYVIVEVLGRLPATSMAELQTVLTLPGDRKTTAVLIS